MGRYIRLVAIDLDRTVLHDDKTLSRFTVEVFHTLRRLQINTCVLTARQKASAEVPCWQLDCSGTAFCNGAIVNAAGSVITQYPLSRQSARAFLYDVGSYPCSVTCNGAVYTNFKTNYSIQVDSWDLLAERELLRILLHNPPPKLLARLATTSYTGLHIQCLERGDIVATSQLATKEHALKTLMTHWGICSEETVAFGDDLNDIGFMAIAGTSVAVQNAEEQVKLAANALCSSNNEDGPALWLNEHVLRSFNAEVV